MVGVGLPGAALVVVRSLGFGWGEDRVVGYLVGPGATLGAGNELDHGLRVGADQRIPEKALRFS